jgi:DNA invertase Pin-like site-specific DNA recombinase
MINNILIEVMGAVAQNEREKILERQKEGISAMPIIDGKRVSTKTGRPMGKPVKEVVAIEKYRGMVADGTMSVTESCKQLGISRTQWYRLCK